MDAVITQVAGAWPGGEGRAARVMSLQRQPACRRPERCGAADENRTRMTSLERSRPLLAGDTESSGALPGDLYDCDSPYAMAVNGRRFALRLELGLNIIG